MHTNVRETLDARCSTMYLELRRKSSKREKERRRIGIGERAGEREGERGREIKKKHVDIGTKDDITYIIAFISRYLSFGKIALF